MSLVQLHQNATLGSPNDEVDTNRIVCKTSLSRSRRFTLDNAWSCLKDGNSSLGVNSMHSVSECKKDKSSIPGEDELSTTTNDAMPSAHGKSGVIFEILALVSVLYPNKPIDNVVDLLSNFEGREEKLRDTLRKMYERSTLHIGSNEEDEEEDDDEIGIEFDNGSKDSVSLLSYDTEDEDETEKTVSYITDDSPLNSQLSNPSLHVLWNHPHHPSNINTVTGVPLDEGLPTEQPAPNIQLYSTCHDEDNTSYAQVGQDIERGSTTGNSHVIPSYNVQDLGSTMVAEVSDEIKETLDPTPPMPCWKNRLILIPCTAFLLLMAFGYGAVLSVFYFDFSHGGSSIDNGTTPTSLPTTFSASNTAAYVSAATMKPSSLPLGPFHADAATKSPAVSEKLRPIIPPSVTPLMESSSSSFKPPKKSSSSPSMSPSNQSSKQSPTVSSSSSCYPIEVIILYDAFPFGTGYALTEASSVATSFSFFPSDDSLAYQYHSQSYCIEQGSYKFTMYDKKGDGLCCTAGNGKYIVSSDGVILAQGSEFTFKEETLFELPA